MDVLSDAKKKFSVLIVDDEPTMRTAMEDILSLHTRTLVASDGDEAVRIATESLPDLILLDLDLPKLNGFSVCEALKQCEATRLIPVVVVTGSDSVDQRIEAYLKGADDYLQKPFRSKELVARVSSKLRRREVEREKKRILRRGTLEMDLARIEARVNGAQIQLSVLEFRLLEFFARRSEEALSRQRIVSAVWNDAVVLDRTVDTHVVSLRKMLAGCDYTINTIYGMGYIFQPAKILPSA